MDVLLINPPSDLRKSYGKLAEVQGAVEPLGVAYITALLEKEQIKVGLNDAYVLGLDGQDISKMVAQHKPWIVGFSCVTPNAPIVYPLAKALKESYKNIIIVMGNIHPSVFAEETLEAGYADVIVHAEGEYTMLELVRILAKQGDLTSVRGISYRVDGQVVHNPPRPWITDLDALPFPARHHLPMGKYRQPPHGATKHPMANMLATRGCPNQCTFCSLTNQGKIYRKRSVNNIVDEMEHLIETYQVKHISFLDAIFPLGKKFALDFCQEVIKRGLPKKVSWDSETRVNAVDKEMLEAMREAGCTRISYGIEAGSQVLLDNIKKGFTIDQARKAVKLTKEVGISTSGLFMLGLPGETKELAKQTINFALELDTDFAKFNITVPYPGSELFEQTRREGRIKLHDWSNFTSYPTYAGSDPVYVPEGMTKEELMSLQRGAIRRFYLRPHLILRQLFKVRTVRLKDYFLGLRLLRS